MDASNENDELVYKEDGLKLIIEVEYELEELKKYIAESCLAGKCDFLSTTTTVTKICEGFLQMLKNEELNLDEITTLFVAVSRVYYMRPTIANLECRMHLLYKTFRYVDTLHPMHIHVATKRLWEGMRLDGINFVFNLITLCHHMSAASETGRAIAICLMWAILGEITETEISMHCFRRITDLMKMLQEIDNEILQNDNFTQIVYLLVKVVGFIINSIVFAPNDEFKKAGYRNCFTYAKRDLEKLKKWADELCYKLSVSPTKASNCWDLRMIMKEYLNANIITILDDKISDM